MKIIVLSDLNWEAHLRSISDKEIEKFKLKHLTLLRYERINRYYQIIIKEKAELVLFAGDVTGDGSCGHGFQNAFKLLLRLLDLKQITTYFIRGNHDEDEMYQNVISYSSTLKHSKDISGRMINYKGLKILGIPYQSTAYKSKLNTLIKSNNEAIDIVLAHSQLKRRVRLFKLKTKLIITGHYDRKILEHRNSVFISLDNDWEEVSYVTLMINKRKKIVIRYKIRQNSKITFSITEHFDDLILQKRNHILKVNKKSKIDLNKLEKYKDNKLIDYGGTNILYLKYLRGKSYKKVLHVLTKLKNQP